MRRVGSGLARIVAEPVDYALSMAWRWRMGVPFLVVNGCRVHADNFRYIRLEWMELETATLEVFTDGSWLLGGNLHTLPTERI
jgi:hypothetical protein